MSGIPLAHLRAEACCRHRVAIRDDATWAGCRVEHADDAPLVLERAFLRDSRWATINGRILLYLMAVHHDAPVYL
jgi:hypothetical protein